MPTTRLSSKGQVIIPKSIRKSRSWKPGLELEVVDTGEGVLLRPQAVFPRTHIDEVGGCLPYKGPPVPVEDMNGAVAFQRKLAFDPERDRKRQRESVTKRS